MKWLYLQLLFSLLSFNLKAQELSIPFSQEERFDQLIILCDVDGVIREGVDACADKRIIKAFQSLLKNKRTQVAFISGTPIHTDTTLESWRRGNVSLNAVFNHCFDKELNEGHVDIFGVLGGEKTLPNGKVLIQDTYNLSESFELSRLLLNTFFKNVLFDGTDQQKASAIRLKEKLKNLTLIHNDQKMPTTPQEFSEIVMEIRNELDPEFRLVSSGALMEIHVSNPPWNVSRFYSELDEALKNHSFLSKQLIPSQRKLATGYAKKGSNGFNFLLVSKTNKGQSAFHYISEKIKLFSHPLIVTIGDTQVDFPMHKYAHLAFHVGAEQVWKDENLPNCIFVRGQNGEDHQHVEGTLKILHVLEEAWEKPFSHLKDLIDLSFGFLSSQSDFFRNSD